MEQVISGRLKRTTPLLQKTTKPFVVYVLAVFVMSIPIYFFAMRHLWMHELDEHNRIVARKTEAEFSSLHLDSIALVSKFDFWNKLQHGTFIAPLQQQQLLKDSVYTAEKGDAYLPLKTHDKFRILITTLNINGSQYYFRVITSFGETKELVIAIGLITGFFFLSILLGMIFINRKLSKKVWAPFRDTLQKLNLFNLKSQAIVKFQPTDISEFNELHHSLNQLISKNVAAFQSQKEFTENASHEIQTPLAILKNKLDLLLQDEALTEKQYFLVEDMNNALLRSSRINKDLLLLAKIDNQQFTKVDYVNVSNVIAQCMEAWELNIEQKDIALSVTIQSDVVKRGNKILMEVLMNNLLLNAIKYTPTSGNIMIKLSYESLILSNSGIEALPEELMFKRFVRFSTDTSGSGLGLSIIQEICNNQNWQLKYSFADECHQFKIDF